MNDLVKIIADRLTDISVDCSVARIQHRDKYIPKSLITEWKEIKPGTIEITVPKWYAEKNYLIPIKE